MKARKITLTILAVAVAMIVTTAAAFACTGMYIGKDASAEGTVTIARSEDQSVGAVPKRFMVRAAANKAGRVFVDTGTGFKVKLPKKTFKHTYVPDVSYGDGEYPGSCMNEYGVAIIGTVSTSVSKAYRAVDPCTDYNNGIREAIVPALVACQSKTARHACEVTAKLLDEYGAAERNTLLYADKDEAWIFENYGGHSYCAYRMPADCVAVFGNHCMIGEFDPEDHENFIYSANLLDCLNAVETVKEESGKINICKTVSGSTRSEGNNHRNWTGVKTLAPSTEGIDTYDNDFFYPLCYKPDAKVSVLQLMDLFRDRFEGTAYDMEIEGNENYRPIGTVRQSQVHITQIYSDLPADTRCVQWLAMGNAEHSVFIPAFGGITDTHKAYKVDGAYKANSAYWKFKRCCSVAEMDRAHLSKGVKDFWKAQEVAMHDKIQKEIPKVKKQYKKGKKYGRKYVTNLSKKMTAEQLTNSDVIYNPLFYVFTSNVNDRPTRKTTFAQPVNLQAAAKAAGYTVKISKNQITLTKDGIKWGLHVNAAGVAMNGEYYDDLQYSVYKIGKTLYLPGNFADTLVAE